MENQRGGNVRTAWFAIAGFKNKRRGRGRGLSKASRSCKRQENGFSQKEHDFSLVRNGADFQPPELYIINMCLLSHCLW